MMHIGDFKSDPIISFFDVMPRLILLGKTILVEFCCNDRYFSVMSKMYLRCKKNQFENMCYLLTCKFTIFDLQKKS